MKDESINLILERLRRFLEVHNTAKIPDTQTGLLKMHMAHARANKKTKKKDIIINFLLERMETFLFNSGMKKDEKSEAVIYFLMDELEEFYRNTLKK